ncbi:MAG: polysaccharide deacetylase family protein, partial [Phycisphaerae bacterium]
MTTRRNEWPSLGAVPRRLVRWARRHINAASINIVTYHSVAPEEGPFTAGLPLRHTPRDLLDHMTYLRRFFRPMRLSGVIDALRRGQLLDRAVVVTFDDGFRDTLVHAGPILRRLGIPMSVFVVTSVVDNRDLIWRHKLAWLIRHGLGHAVYTAMRREYARAGHELAAGGRAGSERTPDLYELTRRFYRPDILPPLLDELLARHGWSGAALAQRFRPYLQAEEIAAADPEWVEFENHTHTHPMLSALTADEQLREMSLARDALTDLTGRSPTAVAYPFGLRD